MGKYIAKRLLLLIPTTLLVCVIIFALLRMLPGDAVDALQYQLQSQGSYDVTREEVEAMLGMDKPAVAQFFIWLGSALRGDLGDCLFQSESVLAAIGRQLPASLELGILTLILTNLISIPLGLFCAARQNSGGDVLVRVLSLVLMSVPVFWLATLVLVYPAILWGYSPPTQYVSLLENPFQNLQMFFMPALLNAMTQAGMQLRTVRTVTLDVMRTDYVRTAGQGNAGAESHVPACVSKWFDSRGDHHRQLGGRADRRVRNFGKHFWNPWNRQPSDFRNRKPGLSIGSGVRAGVCAVHHGGQSAGGYLL